MTWNNLRKLYRRNARLFWKYLLVQTGIFLITVAGCLGLFFLINFCARQLGFGPLSTSTLGLIVFGIIMLATLITAVVIHLRGKDREDEETPTHWHQHFWVQLLWVLFCTVAGIGLFIGLDSYLEGLPEKWGWLYLGWKIGKRVVLVVAAIGFWLWNKYRKRTTTRQKIDGSFKNTSEN